MTEDRPNTRVPTQLIPSLVRHLRRGNRLRTMPFWFLAVAASIFLSPRTADATFNAGLDATPNPNAGHYSLTWTKPSERSWVQERFNSGSWVTVSGIAPDPPMSFTNKAAGSYEYRIKWQYHDCSGGGGRGGCDLVTEYSTTETVTVEAPPPPISQIISLDGSYHVSWPTIPLATTYTVQEKPSGGSWSQVYTGSGTSVAISGKAAGDYEYRLKACGSADGCPYSGSALMAVETGVNIQGEPGISTSTVAGSIPFAASADRRGSSVISIPLRLPPGVNGLSPQLGLTYSSGASPALFEDNKSEGELGYGWQVSGISEIRRCRVGLVNSTIAYDATDRLCLDGNALVKVAGSGYWADNAEYRTERNTFAKILARGTGLTNRYFEVTLANGNVAIFGDTNASRLVAPTKTDPYLWSQRLATDNFGNQISYTWHEFASTGTNYIRWIDYAGARIEFRYEDRCKSLNDCDIAKVQNGDSIPGIKVQAVALNRILTRFDGKWVNDYRLDNNYVNGYLRLEQLQQCGYNEAGSASTCMSPLQFAWDTLTINDTGTSESADLLVVDEVTNSFGDKTYFDYAVIDGSGSGNHALHVARHADFPDKPLPSNVGTSTRQRALVQYVRSPDGNGGTTTTEFRYQDYPLYDALGRGFLGFAAVYSEFYNQSQFDPGTESSFDAHRRQYRQFRFDFPYTGFKGRQITEVDTDPGVGETWTQVNKSFWKYNKFLSHSSTVHFAYLSDQFSSNQELRADGTLGYGNGTRLTTTYCWWNVAAGVCSFSGTAQEVPTQIITETRTGLVIGGLDNINGVWGQVDGNVFLSGQTHMQSRTTDFSNIPASWLHGFVSRSETGWGLASVTETQEVEFSRDATTNNKPGVIQYFDGDPEYDRTVSLTYDAFGNVTNTNDTGIDQVTSTSSSSSFLNSRYPQTVTNSLSHSSTLGYDLRFGAIDSVTDPNSDVTTVTRDEFGRVISAVGADGTTVSTSYQSCSSGCSAVTWATPRLKVTRTYSNNSAQVAPDEIAYLDTRGLTLLTEVEAFSSSDGWVRTQYHYDASGQLSKRSLPYFSVGGTVKYVQTFYDYKGREVFVDNPDGTDISRDIYADVGVGNYVNIVVSGAGRSKRYRFNRAGQLADTTDGYGEAGAVTAAYTYTVRGDLDTVTVGGKLVADVGYDNAGNRDTLWEPNSGTSTFDYYSNQLLKESTDALSNTARYVYDALGRATSRTDGYGGASPIANSWVWDTALNGKGRLASRSQGTQFTESYAYDGSGRIDTITASVDVSGFTDNGNYIVDYGYDTNGRLNTIGYPNLTVTNVYNTTGYMTQVKKGSTILHTYSDVDAFGNIVGESYANGLQTARTYDADTGELTSITTGTAGLPKSVQDLMFEWQTDGALYKRIDKRGTTSVTDDLSEELTYDSIGRLTQALTSATGRDLDFTYDAHGNLLSKVSSVSGDLDVTGYSYPTTSKPHQLSTVTIGGISNTLNYDLAGNITQYNAATGDDTFIDYDTASRVIKITVGSSSGDATPTARDEFWHGPDGQRFLRKASWMDGATLQESWTLYLLGGVFEEVHPEHDAAVNYRQRVLVTSNVQHQFVKYPSSSATNTEYLHRDHLGGVVTITNGSGSVLNNMDLDFDPFGRQRGDGWDRDASSAERDTFADGEDTMTGRGFTDHEMLNRTGFVHMNGRVYDSRIGRFIQADPIIGRPENSQNYNRYTYVFNTPLSATDPTGLDCGLDDSKWTCIGGQAAENIFEFVKSQDSANNTGGIGGVNILEDILDFYSCRVVGLCGSGGFPGWSGVGSGTFGSGPCGEICLSFDPHASSETYHLRGRSEGDGTSLGIGDFIDVALHSIRNNNTGFTLGADLPARSFDKLRGLFGGRFDDLPDVGLSISFVVQHESHPDGEDVALVFTRRVIVGGGVVVRGYFGIDINHGSVSSMAGNGLEGSAQVGPYGFSLNATQSFIPTGSSLNGGYGLAVFGAITSSSVLSLKHGYIPSGCADFVCVE